MPVFIKNFFCQHAIPHLYRGTVKNPIFMQDNAPGYKVKTVLSFLEEEGIAVMKWPPQSPDMNPIENVFKIIGEKAQNRNPQNIDDLWGFLKEEWKSITTTFCRKLIGSCGRRYQRKIPKEASLNIEFFFCLYTDLTRIYDAFLNFWPWQNLYFCFFSCLLIYCKRKFRTLYI